MMVGIVIVSHSAKIAEGICDLARQMGREGQIILPAGGMPDGGIGTDAMLIYKSLIEADKGDGVIILADLGSAVLSTETAFEFLSEEQRSRFAIADAPVVEGAILATVQASVGATLPEVMEAAISAREMRKV
ncbi:MAG: dhaM [Anaerosporomusa subterranea]|jgi:dihydroxyacetone kinase phosphotransfer subunit|nr:dhaM [Anaerosporomusa subterranea]